MLHNDSIVRWIIALTLAVCVILTVMVFLI